MSKNLKKFTMTDKTEHRVEHGGKSVYEGYSKKRKGKKWEISSTLKSISSKIIPVIAFSGAVPLLVSMIPTNTNKIRVSKKTKGSARNA